MTRTGDGIPAEPEGISAVLDRLSRLALVATLVNKVQVAVDTMLTSTAVGHDVRSRLAATKGLFVAPDILSGALIPGGACGGVLMARAPDGRDWNGPSFHLLGGVALGLELGGRPSTIFLLAMTDRGVGAFLSNDGEPHGEARIRAVPLTAATPAITGEEPDILGFAHSEGTWSSLSVDRAVITACDGLNHAVYGRDVTPADIVRGAARRRHIGVVLHSAGGSGIG